MFALGVDVAYEVIEGELVAINLGSGAYFSIQGSGVDIWHALLRGSPLDAIISDIRGRYPDAAEAVEVDARRFVERTVQEHLLVPSGAPVTTTPPPTGQDDSSHTPPPAGYIPPRLEKFDDMADLFLLDPIHDVSDAGWPHVPPRNR